MTEEGTTKPTRPTAAEYEKREEEAAGRAETFSQLRSEFIKLAEDAADSFRLAKTWDFAHGAASALTIAAHYGAKADDAHKLAALWGRRAFDAHQREAEKRLADSGELERVVELAAAKRQMKATRVVLVEPEYAEAAGLRKGIAWAVLFTIIAVLALWLLVRL